MPLLPLGNLNSRLLHYVTSQCIVAPSIIHAHPLTLSLSPSVSLHLSLGMAQFDQIALPQGTAGASITHKGFWVLDSMWKFENISFSHTVEQNKYLTCAECEREVVGVQRLNENKRFCVAYDLVSYDAAAASSTQAANPAAPAITAETLAQMGFKFQ
jgi:hypothetical protein